eukprot:CAMPEP_0174236542 /NCGR_PEP_ID=MMETSP0417-20130205/5648_1 /TAXON_ID=242541 /ORGANISM="Mayorella sp, Strain BSH-02190019" /LENGTH=496 /DNA_ID=CAMNT_0015315207 /DNA_START=70 /DNA_END=1557 /DNA_ORIENTATION=+
MDSKRAFDREGLFELSQKKLRQEAPSNPPTNLAENAEEKSKRANQLEYSAMTEESAVENSHPDTRPPPRSLMNSVRGQSYRRSPSLSSPLASATPSPVQRSSSTPGSTATAVAPPKNAPRSELQPNLLFRCPPQREVFGQRLLRTIDPASSSCETAPVNRTERAQRMPQPERHRFAGASIRGSLDAVQSRAQLGTVEELLLQSHEVLRCKANLSNEELSHLLEAVSAQVLVDRPCAATALVSFSQAATGDSAAHLRRDAPHRFMSTGCPILDGVLGGGVRTGMITEIAGEAGAGKTQLGLQLGVQAHLPLQEGGLDGGVVYLCTEGPFSIDRFTQLADLIEEQRGPLHSWHEHTWVRHIRTVEELHGVLNHRLPVLMRRNTVKLVVIDSIAALFRTDFENKEMFHRSELLWDVARQLKYLASEHHAAIVVINQATDIFDQESPQLSPRYGPAKKAALGLSWSTCVNVRIFLSKSPTTEAARQFWLLFSPIAPSTSA